MPNIWKELSGAISTWKLDEIYNNLVHCPFLIFVNFFWHHNCKGTLPNKCAFVGKKVTKKDFVVKDAIEDLRIDYINPKAATIDVKLH